MAWLVAYNEGFFDRLEGVAVQTRLGMLLPKVGIDNPGLAAERKAWLDSVRDWLRERDDEPSP